MFQINNGSNINRKSKKRKYHTDQFMFNISLIVPQPSTTLGDD